ncbi:ribonuclease P protein component [Candidatus Saccharibacteria bacterium]|nr:ribonuclease P protein component [Candidatus Saccharibacteria bacterium]
MIGRANRFHGHRSVSNVRGEVAHGRLMSIRFTKNKKGDYRAAVVVSKKIAPSAVVRNRIRRRIFELVRTEKLLAGQPIDVIIYAKTSAIIEITSLDLGREVSGLTKKALAKVSAQS